MNAIIIIIIKIQYEVNIINELWIFYFVYIGFLAFKLDKKILTVWNAKSLLDGGIDIFQLYFGDYILLDDVKFLIKFGVFLIAFF